MKALLDCLRMQDAVLMEFLQALDEEARAMTEGRFRCLPALIERKTELAGQMAELDRERERLQQQAGFQPGRCAQPAVVQAWNQLHEHARQARADNHRNAVMTHTLLDFTRQAIRTLQGGAGGLYGSNGRHPTGQLTSKSLGQG